jgi:predicted dehydrogenase
LEAGRNQIFVSSKAEVKSKALVIGCGNIGALYDLERENISNHARALMDNGQFELSFSDQDVKGAEYAASKYGGNVVADLTHDTLDSFDWISICTPTNTHFDYLEKLKGLEPKIVLCEKPISYASEEISELQNIFDNSQHSIFVNYFRRFQPAYQRLKSEYSNLLDIKKLQKCRIEYCRGLLNNASHGLDLLEFLFERPFELDAVDITSMDFDVFKEDPTLSLSGSWDHVVVMLEGRKPESSPLFNVHLSFIDGEVHFTESGNQIQIIEKIGVTEEESTWKGCMKDYMKYSIKHVLDSVTRNGATNFTTSLALNSRMLNLINK